jgi:hypothetical protein
MAADRLIDQALACVSEHNQFAAAVLGSGRRTTSPALSSRSRRSVMPPEEIIAGQNSISLAGFDVKRTLPILAVKVRFGNVSQTYPANSNNAVSIFVSIGVRPSCETMRLASVKCISASTRFFLAL